MFWNKWKGRHNPKCDKGKAVLRGKFIVFTVLLQETRKSSNKQPKFTLNGSRRRTTNKTLSITKKIIKVRAETNKIESKRNTKVQ